MNQPSARSVLVMLFSAVVVFPLAAFAQRDVVDLTATFVKQSAVIDKLADLARL